MVERQERYAYTPLNHGEIRLLYSATEPNTDEVTWTLRAERLLRPEGEPPLMYDALSYTWGDLGQTYPLTCGGRELQIHKNLKSALPYLARRESSLPIWIDAVCINQADDAEKAVQISMMHQIYRQAEMVWIWLGALQIGPEVLALLQKLIAIGPELASVYRLGNTCDPIELGLPAVDAPIWQQVAEIICNKWYDRLWIVQEAALPRTVRFLCGATAIPWDTLEQVTEMYLEITHGLKGPGGARLPLRRGDQHTVFLIRRREQTSSEQTRDWADHLLSVLCLTAGKHACYDPRDYVLGLMGFIDEVRAKELAIAESRTWSLAELYTRFTRALLVKADLSARRWWTVIHEASATNKTSGLPSWVPDYHNMHDESHKAPLDLSVQVSVKRRDGLKDKASRAADVAKQSPENYRMLIMRGKAVDTIERIFDDIPDQLVWRYGFTDVSAAEGLAILWRFADWERKVRMELLGPDLDLVESWPDDPSMRPVIGKDGIALDDYWRTLHGNCLDRRDLRVTYRDHCAALLAIPRWLELLDQEVQWEEEMKLKGEDSSGQEFPLSNEDQATMALSKPGGPILTLICAAHDHLYKRKLFSTTSGRVGFGPARIQPGDVVCVLNNAFVPHTIRRQDKQNPNEYELIGETYVHGMMNGEVEDLNVPVEDFHLV
ncbi:heterokaryon incompatibility protein-domain-containing protein [Microdochium bolleyi]|uniref:Heterokaryon incompatibility protein-domain-containing protein n=1 Tax=Microdochium bolleyi TaxID=196109 RepID=A0A136IUP4_9PEZI|nr:heterokaryon incompatibility protein-domain-containing protein [Microdochium bolleyi]